MPPLIFRKGLDLKHEVAGTLAESYHSDLVAAVKESDYLAQSFLQWFIDEQLEEVVKMDRLLGVVRQSGEKNLLMVEAYLVHIEKAS